MNSFRYKVSLRIRHPDIDPASITETIGLQPRRTWRVGERRATPTGTVLEDANRNSYWTHRYSIPNDDQCAEFIRSSAMALTPHREYFKQLRSEGGDIEFFIGWFSDQNFGDTFPHDLLGILADLHIDLGFDVYPG